MTATPKKYYIKTLGCQANEADSNTMSGLLEALGFEPLKLPQEFKNEKEELYYVFCNTDIFIVNSCSVRQKSEDKVYGLGKVVKQIADEGKQKPFVVLSGCMVGSVTGERKRYEFDELKNKTPWVDLYMNPSQVSQLPEFLVENGLVEQWLLAKLNKQDLELKGSEPKHAYINISFGCDNFCTFCVVPYARGKEISRPQVEIMRDVKRAISQGITQITLCGQNVNSWGLATNEKLEIRTNSDQKLPFAQLLRDLHEIEGLEKIDFLSSNPFDFTKDLLDAIKLPKISNYLHIAVQSGNNEILKKMNRRHTIEDFLKLIEEIKKAKPQVELGTDLIVGFPTETEKQFLDTIELVKKVNFAVAFIAMYSPRKGTPAQKFFADDVSLAEKRRRHAELTKVWKQTKKSK